jgi:hypothetical protein
MIIGAQSLSRNLKIFQLKGNRTLIENQTLAIHNFSPDSNTKSKDAPLLGFPPFLPGHPIKIMERDPRPTASGPETPRNLQTITSNPAMPRQVP